jgi:hypothetical protein
VKYSGRLLYSSKSRGSGNYESRFRLQFDSWAAFVLIHGMAHDAVLS